MTDDEIVSKITSQTTAAIVLRLNSRLTRKYDPENLARIDRMDSAAKALTLHAIKLIAIHRDAVTRWMKARGSQVQQ